MKTHYDISMPRLNYSGISSDTPILVTRSSSLKARKAVERVAVYFRREFEYDFVQFSALEKDDDYRAYLWTPGSLRRYLGEEAVVVGACCFRWRQWENAPHGWALQWVWFHPYARRQGYLSDAWANFRSLYGQFFIEPPLSQAMEAFLLKHGQNYRGDLLSSLVVESLG